VRLALLLSDRYAPCLGTGPHDRSLGCTEALVGSPTVDPDAMLLEGLRAGDEAAFRALVSRYHTRLVRFAESMVPSRAVAEEVVQDTWLGVVKGIHGFEGRSAVKTWLFRIVSNRARSTGVREVRSVPVGDDHELEGRFDAAGRWSEPPEPWSEGVDRRLVAEELAGRVRDLLPYLPDAQRQVVVLRDLEGLDAMDVCDLLGITAGNQRVLLHRGRSRLRSLLEKEFGGR
jgi:RNA polymerase sigma-70 factor, ECF subfamily